MRKITGYIGALIIVFALMGSILMGYALNVNGNSTIANEYDYITDVSGLYSHSQEPSYIDYNPASNYIGYSTREKYDNSGIDGYLTFKKFDNGTHTFVFEGANVTIDGVSQGAMVFNPVSYHLQFVNEKIAIQYTPSGSINRLYVYGENTLEQYNKITLNVNDSTITYTGITKTNMVINGIVTVENTSNLCYYTGDDWDYINIRLYNNPNITGDIPAYYSSVWPIFSFGLYNHDCIFINEEYYDFTNDTFNNGDIYNETLTGSGVYHTNSIMWATAYETAIPRFVYYNILGINYTDSNRVNNYPIEIEYDDTRTTVNASVDLLAVSSADYMTNKPALIASQSFDNSAVYSYLTYQATMYKVNSYKLSDIFSTLTIPVNTNSVRIDAPTTTAQYGYWWNGASGTDVMNFTGLSDNWVVLAPFGNVAQGEIVDFNGMANQYIVYYPGSGKCDLYNANGVKLGTYGGLDQLHVIFADPTGANEVKIDFKYRGNNRINTDYDYWTATKTNPFINLTYNTGGEITTTHYADITKGYSIKASNTVNTVWDNQYLNGNIQLLFRADDTLAIYSNDIIIGDNTISIDYNTNRFYVQLNGADPVDIGTWRNILLNIDLRNGELSAIPVRTFNSYTNVVLDNTSIFIGELVNSAPTNIIEWAPTTDSLTFNVYSTSVFMDTYGVVMVNPTLNITDYFTDLNNFYRLRLFNFSVLGSTITINGVTYDVTNDTITINEQTIQVKNMAITYADGHAYISDSNADIDLGEVTDNNISMAGAWYFETDLYRGYTTQKMVYEWNWGDFILNNTQFCIMYMGLALVGLIVARHYCNMSISDYIVLILSFVIALTVQVVA